MATRRPVARNDQDTATRFFPLVVPAGDSALMLELAPQLDFAANEAAHVIAEDVRRAALDGVTDVVAAIVTVTVFFDAQDAAQAATRRAAIADALMATLARVQAGERGETRAPVEIPVCYDAHYAPDLAEVAERTGLAVDDVIARHVAGAHHVLMIGFAPGFPYLGGLDPRLAAVPRRATPRARVEAGSVAIANGQSAVYPFASPGGWSVIGRTPLKLFDPRRDEPALLRAGDSVRFVAITAGEYEARLRAEPR